MTSFAPGSRGNGRLYYAIEPLDQFNELITSMRIEKGLNMKQAASYFGVSLPTLRRLMSGESISVETRQKIESKVGWFFVVWGVKFVVR